MNTQKLLLLVGEIEFDISKIHIFIHVSVYEYDMEVSLSIEGLMLLVVEREFDLWGKWKEQG